jgi:2-polyprenyl-3-methyl-5-hydroxy-6-metoxy-1,4-benzoquinol methylase
VAKRLLAVSGHSGRVNFAVQDAIQVESSDATPKYDGIVSAMLAEHLTYPRPLFAALSKQLSPNGLVFFSTALESAQRDHVFEYHHESEPLVMAEEAGLRAARMISDTSAMPAGSRFLPRATAMILEPR